MGNNSGNNSGNIHAAGFNSGKEVARAREDAIIAAVHEDSKVEWPDSCPAFLADKGLGQNMHLAEAWSRVVDSVDRADETRVPKLWNGFKCLSWQSTRDRFFEIMKAFGDRRPTRTGDRGALSP